MECKNKKKKQNVGIEGLDSAGFITTTTASSSIDSNIAVILLFTNNNNIVWVNHCKLSTFAYITLHSCWWEMSSVLMPLFPACQAHFFFAHVTQCDFNHDIGLIEHKESTENTFRVHYSKTFLA